ncbi:TPA: hypothetical protein H1005_00970 [archaeon]|uniref:Uncharacterized protein n=1 Tax=Candidatus Naiadarchaeum limnaeum TaxID=2756139 RepID=A0A832UW55_9ARCH|nr:hypothetical protein [Candidatus Naiadarchaeales archaeon SRR2090153.bin1042]HIK00880.1 hypothetical protein [Candidatus Naiadarchaeum limnaeum]
MSVPKKIKDALRRFKKRKSEDQRGKDWRNFEEAERKAAALKRAMLADYTGRKVPLESPPVKLLLRLGRPEGFDLIVNRVGEIFIIMDRIEIALVAYHEHGEIGFMGSLFIPKMLASEVGKYRISDLTYPDDFNKIKSIITKWIEDAKEQLTEFEKIVQEHGEKAVHIVSALLKIEEDYRRVFEDRNLQELLQSALKASHEKLD